MKSERLSNRDIVRNAFAAGVPRVEIPDAYKEYGITEMQAREAIKRVRYLGELTYEPLPSNTPEFRKRLSEEKKGKAPEKAIKTITTIWPLVGPLSDRGFIPSEIADITGLARQQVYNALYDKHRKNSVSTRYYDPQVVEERVRRYHQRSSSVKKNGEEIPEEYERDILNLARQIVNLRLIDDLSHWDSINNVLEKRGRVLRTKICGIVFEAVFRAGERQNKSPKKKEIYKRISNKAQEVLYRAEDLYDLSLVRLEAERRSRNHA